jgi:hypothetical protein
MWIVTVSSWALAPETGRKTIRQSRQYFILIRPLGGII